MYIPASQLHQIVVHQLPEPKKAKKTSPVKTRKLLKMLSRSTMDNKMVKLAETGVKDGAKVARKRVCKRAYRTAYRTAHRWAHRWAHRRVCRRTSCSVDVYKHCNYRGYRIHLTPGSYNMHALIRRGMKNDDLSSIRVHGRCVDRLYQHWNFGGRVLTKTRSDSCFTNDRMYIPLSQLHQLVIHEAPEPKKVQDGTKLVQRSWNDQISSIRVAGLSGTRCHTVRYRQRTCRHYCYMVPDGSEKRKKAAEKKMKESVGKKKEKAKKAELKHKEKTKKAVERSRKEKVYKEKMSKKEKQAKYVQKKEKKAKEIAAKKENAAKKLKEKKAKEIAAKKEKAKKHKKEQAAKAEKAQKEKTKKEKLKEEQAAKAEKAQKEKTKKEKATKESAKKAEKRQKEKQLKEKKSKEKAKKAEKATKEAAEKYKAAKKVLEKIDASCKAQAKLKYKALERIKAVAKIVTSLTKTKTKACKAEKKAQEIAKKAKAKLVKARKNSKIAGPGFKFGKDPCKSGSNMFTQKLVLNQRVNVGIIPAGKVNVKIALNTDKDVDTELWTADC